MWAAYVCVALVFSSVLGRQHKPTFTVTNTRAHLKLKHWWNSWWEQFGARYLDQGHLDMQTAGVRTIDLPAMVDGHSSSRATAAAQRDWQYAAPKDYSFQLHLPRFSGTRPCLYRACFY